MRDGTQAQQVMSLTLGASARAQKSAIRAVIIKYTHDNLKEFLNSVVDVYTRLDALQFLRGDYVIVPLENYMPLIGMGTRTRPFRDTGVAAPEATQAPVVGAPQTPRYGATEVRVKREEVESKHACSSSISSATAAATRVPLPEGEAEDSESMEDAGHESADHSARQSQSMADAGRGPADHNARQSQSMADAGREPASHNWREVQLENAIFRMMERMDLQEKQIQQQHEMIM